MSDATPATPTDPVRIWHQVLSPRARLWLRSLSQKRKDALVFGLKDLAIAVNGSRELFELELEFSKSLPANDPRRVPKASGRTSAQGDIKRMFQPDFAIENAYSVGLVEFEVARGGGGRVSLASMGRALMTFSKVTSSG